MQMNCKNVFWVKPGKILSSLLLIAGLLLVFCNVRGQRQPDLSLAHFWSKTPGTLALIKPQDEILVGNNQAYYLQWRIVNNGATPADTIAATDTIKIKTAFGKTYEIVWGQNGFSSGMSQVDTSFIEPGTNPIIFPFGDQVLSRDSVFTNWCDSIYIVSGDAGNQAVDPNTSNDQACDSVLVTYWMSGISHVPVMQGAEVYPNPTTGKVYVKCGFSVSNAQVEIVDVCGKILLAKDVETDKTGQPFSIDVAELTPGTYFLRLIAHNKIIVERIQIGEPR